MVVVFSMLAPKFSSFGENPQRLFCHLRTDHEPFLLPVLFDMTAQALYNGVVMVQLRVGGKENIPSQPSFYLPNRLDMTSLKELDSLLGGRDNVAFMVEEVLAPAPSLARYMKGRKVLSFHFRKSDVLKLRERLLELMREGYDVVFVPGRPCANMGNIADVPMPFMMQLAALHISPVPVFVGFYRDDIWRLFTSGDDYARVAIEVLPKLSPGPLTGDRVLEAWYGASAKLYASSPLLETSLARLLVEGIRKHPLVEVVDGMDDTRLPYYKLLGVAMALARYLKKTVREPRLGIILPPGKAGLIANYACLLAGIVPVNINYTSSEAAFASIVRQSGLKRFVSARAFMSRLPQFPWPKGEAILHLDKTLKSIGMGKIASWVAFARMAPVSLIAMTFGLDQRRGDDEAALLFTSGSSGEPKGVPLTHRMIVSNLTQALSQVSLPPGSAFLCSLPIFHSFGLTICTFLPPVYGFSMVTYPSPLEAKKLNDLIERYLCRLVVTTPTFARSMLRRASEHTYDSVKYFVVGAEKLQRHLAEEFESKCHVQLLEGYGLTETAPVCSVNLPNARACSSQPYYVPSFQAGTVGHLWPGIAVRITDPDDDEKVLPFSEMGMIWLKGANVFSGYIGRDDLNASVFRDGWFKTGDLGSVNLNGFLALGGRRSRFSKIGGEMVPHEVVEQAVEAFVALPEGHSGRAVAVVGVPDVQKGEALVLLSCVHHSQLGQALEEIRAHLVEQGLPRLWSPREIIPVETIPSLPSGKLDLKGCQILAYEALNLPL